MRNNLSDVDAHIEYMDAVTNYMDRNFHFDTFFQNWSDFQVFLLYAIPSSVILFVALMFLQQKMNKGLIKELDEYEAKKKELNK